MIAERPLPTAAVPDVRAIFEALRARYRREPSPPLAERRARLDRLHRAILKRRKAIAAAIEADFGKSPMETEFTETIVTLAELRFARKQLARWMKPQKVATPLSLFGSRSEVRYEPRGVVLVMGPFNYPFQLLMCPLIAALAAGNRAIVRPSEKTPHTNAVMAEIVTEAFAPDEVAFVGGEIETAQALLALPFDHIFFTGSTRVGKVVMKAAAEHLASVTLELGGKSPTIVDAEADVQTAADRVMWGKYLNNGQTCIAPDYVLVHESRERAFLNAAAASIARMYGRSDAERARTRDLCRMIDEGAYERVTALLDESVRAGARVETGGGSDRTERYIAPTVVSNVGWDAPLMREEIFGPVLPVLAYRDLDDALARINARPKPLALYAFSRNAATIERILERTPAGATTVNDTLLHWVNHNLPVGGVGESGIGNYHGYFGFKAFSHERAVLRQTKLSLAPLLAPPFSLKTRVMLAMLDKIS